MNIEEKIWNFVGTGLKLHAFVGGRALCRSSYKETAPEGNKDYCEARTYAQKQHGGVAVCGTCEAKFNAARYEWLEASMAPSTGEGDYLPPAAEQAETVAAPERVRTEDLVPGDRVCPPSYAANDHHETSCPQAPLDPEYAEALAMNAAYDEQATPQGLGDMAAAASAAASAMQESFRSLSKSLARSVATLQTPTQKLLSEIQVRPEILREQLDTLRREQLEDRALIARLLRFAKAHMTNPEMKRVYATISAHNLGEQYQPGGSLDSYVIPPGY